MRASTRCSSSIGFATITRALQFVVWHIYGTPWDTRISSGQPRGSSKGSSTSTRPRSTKFDSVSFHMGRFLLTLPFPSPFRIPAPGRPSFNMSTVQENSWTRRHGRAQEPNWGSFTLNHDEVDQVRNKSCKQDRENIDQPISSLYKISLSSHLETVENTHACKTMIRLNLTCHNHVCVCACACPVVHVLLTWIDSQQPGLRNIGDGALAVESDKIGREIG